MYYHVTYCDLVDYSQGGMIGILGTAALQQAWGVTIWNQWDIYDAMLEHSFTGPMRFFVFLLAFCSLLYSFGTRPPPLRIGHHRPLPHRIQHLARDVVLRDHCAVAATVEDPRLE